MTLLTGFLGAGKTTLLNRILSGDHGLRVGVLVNDFGDINIDAELVEGVGENTISLTNGCICCEIRDDLVDSLEELVTNIDSIDYVVLEASGIADPEGIMMTFVDQRYDQLIRLDSVTCVVDAEAIFTHGDDNYLNALKLRQIGFSDLVVLNKTDLVTEDHVEVIREWIGAHMKRVRIIEAVRANVPLDILLTGGRFNPEAVPTSHSELADAHQIEDHASSFDRWSHQSSEPFDIERLRKMVQQQLPDTVYRCKGIIHTTDDPSQQVALHVVGRRTDIVGIGDWGEQQPQNRIVAIGRGIDQTQLDHLFTACLST